MPAITIFHPDHFSLKEIDAEVERVQATYPPDKWRRVNKIIMPESMRAHYERVHRPRAGKGENK